MNFKRRRRASGRASAVELTPLIDVVLLLLIFFMVSTTFVHGALEVVLPTATAAEARISAGAVEVRVSAAGEVAVGGRVLAETTFDALRRALEQARQTALEHAAGRATVVVFADADAKHQAVTRVLDAAGRAGLRDVRLATRPAPAHAPSSP